MRLTAFRTGVMTSARITDVLRISSQTCHQALEYLLQQRLRPRRSSMMWLNKLAHPIPLIRLAKRDNLRLACLRLKGPMERAVWLARVIQRYVAEGKVGIVYALTKRKVDDLTDWLQSLELMRKPITAEKAPPAPTSKVACAGTNSTSSSLRMLWVWAWINPTSIMSFTRKDPNRSSITIKKSDVPDAAYRSLTPSCLMRMMTKRSTNISSKEAFGPQRSRTSAQPSRPVRWTLGVSTENSC